MRNWLGYSLYNKTMKAHALISQVQNESSHNQSVRRQNSCWTERSIISRMSLSAMSIIFEVYDRQIICNVSSGYSLVNV